MHQQHTIRMALDAALVQTVAAESSLPMLFVSSGQYFLSQKSQESVTTTSEDGEVDLYRDTLLRYAGYANEVGEAFRPLVPPWVVPASYAVAIAYVSADTIDKSKKVLQGSKYASSAQLRCALIEGIDAFLWQITASVALPGFTIHQLVGVAVALIAASDLEPSPYLDALPTALGLLTIPFIVSPLDELAEQIMDFTLRKLWNPYLESCLVE